MARHREFDEDKVLDALKEVFWQYGFEGTSYTHIMKATGLKKGSLYAAFGDKRALYQKALHRYDQKDISSAVNMLHRDSLTPAMRIEILMTGPVDASQTDRGRWGCLLCNAAVDQAPTDKDTEDTVQASIERFKAAIIHVVGDEEKADHILGAYFGARVLVKAGFGKDRMKNIRSAVLKTL